MIWNSDKWEHYHEKWAIAQGEVGISCLSLSSERSLSSSETFISDIS